MRLVLDRRARLWLRRLPRVSLYSAGEIVLLCLLALQCARLIYAVATPPGPIGDWRADNAGEPTRAILAAFDPFHRLSDGGGPVVVTALNLKLYGIRADQASGRGSAIVGLPDGGQASYAVGDEILSGVTLKAVAFDHVTIARGGADEQLYLDQSAPATLVSPDPPRASRQALLGDIAITPRLQGARVLGYVLTPRGGGGAFAAVGLRPGDVLLSVNGAPVGGPTDFAAMFPAGGGTASVEVERSGARVPLTIRVGP